MKKYRQIIMMMASATALAVIFFSCNSRLSVAEKLDLSRTPLQTVEDMYMIQTENGEVSMRVQTPCMQRFENDTMTFELFPKGLNVYAYKEDGVLESTIRSDEARHEKKKASGEEIWKAYGNVVVKNIIKQETMQTDTLYWDRKNQEIYTDCYIRMFSPKGFMQGFGMRSDERARNSIIMQPFNSFSIVVEDSTQALVDSANFIGPLIKKQ